MTDLETLQELSRKAFASTYGFMLMSADYHWNVTGPDFMEHHELFGRVYKEVDRHIDVFAEQLKGIQTWAPATFTQLHDTSSIVGEWTGTKYTPEEMLHNLYLANGKIATDLISAYTAAERVQEHGMANYLSERMAQHRKHGWMLYASMKVI
jgi:starvation-inducible DNA-binding protein